jgi:hypothetical protein
VRPRLILILAPPEGRCSPRPPPGPIGEAARLGCRPRPSDLGAWTEVAGRWRGSGGARPDRREEPPARLSGSLERQRCRGLVERGSRGGERSHEGEKSEGGALCSIGVEGPRERGGLETRRGVVWSGFWGLGFQPVIIYHDQVLG